MVERKVERSFDAGGQPALRIDSFYGTVNVREVAGAESIGVVVIQTSVADTEADMDRRLGALDLKIGKAADGAVVLSAHFRRSVTWTWENWPPVGLVFEVTVPARCDVEIRTGEGQIVVGSVAGRVDLASESGSIFAKEIDGSVKARSRSGAVAITACTGAIDVRTETANITVGRAGGRTVLASRGGYIEVQRASGQVIVRGDGSDAQVGFVSPIREPADLLLSGGSLVVELENNAASTLDLRASRLGRVNVRGKLPMDVQSGGVGKSTLQSTVNGGGPKLVARTSGGNVWVRSVEPFPVATP
ncbi:MAG: hypothetical protein H7Y06_04825 [Opitutaceae bacterium]|nr:hypothetical protein [Opitutaceae bacterium]